MNSYCNEALVQSVRFTTGKMTIIYNGVTITTNIKPMMNWYGELWLIPKYNITILLLDNFKKTYRVTYDNANKYSFVVLQPRK